jgi:hypothetical protein
MAASRAWALSRLRHFCCLFLRLWDRQLFFLLLLLCFLLDDPYRDCVNDRLSHSVVLETYLQLDLVADFDAAFDSGEIEGHSTVIDLCANGESLVNLFRDEQAPSVVGAL